MNFSSDNRLTVPIKGMLPKGHYSKSMQDVWTELPVAEDSNLAFVRIVSNLQRCRQILGEPDLSLTEEANAFAVSDVSGLFTPQQLGRSTRGGGPGEIVLPEPRPYPFRSGPAGVIYQAFAWADSNIKLAVEDVSQFVHMSSEACDEFVQCMFRVFVTVLQLQDRRLERELGFNTSAYLQERILSLALGSLIQTIYADRELRGSVANGIVADALALIGEKSATRLFAMSLVAGASWNVKRLLADERPSCEVVADILVRESKELNWGLNDFAPLLDTFDRKGQRSDLVVVLDDNGEAAVDLAVVQQLLIEFPGLHVTLPVNQLPVSVNLSMGTLSNLLAMPLYSQLAANDRFHVVAESQQFNALEPSLLTSETLDAFKGSDCIYLKGVQLLEIYDRAYYSNHLHALVVYGHSSVSVSGWPEGTALAVEVASGTSAYLVGNEGIIATLRESCAG